MKQLHEFATLQDAKEYEFKGSRFISKSTMSLYLKSVNLYLYIIEVSQGKHDGIEIHKAKETCLMIVNSLNSGNADGKDFNFIQGHQSGFGDANIAEIDNMIANTMPEKAAELTQLKAICINHCNPVSKPYKNATQTEIDTAKAQAELKANMDAGLYSFKTVSDWGGQDLVIDVPTELPIPMPFTVWITETGFKQENAGRSRTIKEAGKYKIDMSGIRKRGEVEVRVPYLNAEYTASI